MNETPTQQHTLFTSLPRLLIFIFAAAAVGITLLLFPVSYLRKSDADAAMPESTPVPTHSAGSASVSISLSATPAPPASATDYPEGAVDFTVNGTVVFTLCSPGEAEEVCRLYMQYCAELPLEQNEYFLSAEAGADVVLTEPTGKGNLLTVEEALCYLEAHPSLLPVIRCTRTVELQTTLPENTETVSSLLLPGTHIIRRLERPAYMLYYTDKEYEGTTLLSLTEADGFLIGSAAGGRITETGAEAEEASPDPAPGSLSAQCPVALALPLKGKVKNTFGKDAEGVIHYGVEYTTEAGYAVYAPGEGTVIYCGTRGHLGNVIEINHGNSGFVSRLIGFDSEITVTLGQQIKKGDRLGKVAASSTRSKPVFRYELLLNGVPVDPLLYLK